MEVNCDDKAVYFSGLLDESFEVEKVTDAIENQSLNRGSPCRVNFAGVKYANSMGIVNWIEVLDSLSSPIIYEFAPKWLVTQFNMVPRLINGENLVNRIEVPFFGRSSEVEKTINLSIGVEIPVLESYEGFLLGDFDVGDEVYVPDFNSEKYFDFISKNYKLFSSI